MRILEGAVYEHAAPSGSTVTATDGQAVYGAVAADGVATLEGLPPGRYWLSVGTPDGALSRAGTLDVEPLADPVEVRMMREVERLNEKIADLDTAEVHQVTDESSGTTRAKAQLPTLIRQRNNAEARLADYRRRCAGVGPVR